MGDRPKEFLQPRKRKFINRFSDPTLRRFKHHHLSGFVYSEEVIWKAF